MTFSIFRSGLAPRIALAIAYATLAFGAVAAVERASARRNSTAGAPTPAQHAPVDSTAVAVHLELEAVQPPASWKLRADGNEIALVATSDRSAEARAELARGAEITVDVQSRADSAAAANAVRLRIVGPGVSLDRTWWCAGDDVFSLRLDRGAAGESAR